MRLEDSRSLIGQLYLASYIVGFPESVEERILSQLKHPYSSALAPTTYNPPLTFTHRRRSRLMGLASCFRPSADMADEQPVSLVGVQLQLVMGIFLFLFFILHSLSQQQTNEEKVFCGRGAQRVKACFFGGEVPSLSPLGLRRFAVHG